MSSPPKAASKADQETREEEVETDEEEEMKGITLAMIPPLRYLYKNKTLKQAATEARRFPYRGDLLDRVSLL